jgi:hypothetical protein
MHHRTSTLEGAIGLASQNRPLLPRSHEMKLYWQIDDKDVVRVKELVASQAGNALIRARHERNLAKAKPAVTKERFWRAMVSMRLTTRQKSGPESHVARFIRLKPFPVTYAVVHQARDASVLIAKVLRKAGGIRFADKIASELAQNLESLEDGLWTDTLAQCNRLAQLVPRDVEIEVARHIQEHFLGFGPKQSRNLLQSLGLTRYEIPIDSRLTDWLNEFGFPVRLTATALGDDNYYRFISDGIQALCERSGVLPCIFDAAVFASRDSAAWTDDNVIF